MSAKHNVTARTPSPIALSLQSTGLEATPNNQTEISSEPVNALGTDLETHSASEQDERARVLFSGRSKLFKASFVTTTCCAQLIAQGQFGMVIIPLKEIGAHLGTSSSGELSWMAASYGLTIGMFLFAAGRLGDLYGPRLLWLAGLTVMLFANLGSGFARTRISFDVTRALAGLGAALAVPNAVSILGRVYPPGDMRSLVFAILGALSPIGFVAAGGVAALLADKASTPWIWWFSAIFCASFIGLGILVLPPDDSLPPWSLRLQFDWIGTLLLVAALGTFNFTWNQAPLVGWSAVYVWTILVLSILLFVLFYVWERRMGPNALIPTEVLSKNNLLVYLCLWLGWMSFGIFLFYTVLFIRNVRQGGTSALGAAAQMSVCAPAGALAALIVPALITRFSGHVIFLFAMLAFLAGNVLAAVTPVNSSYWSVTFPSLLLVIAGPDMGFSTGQLIVSNSVDRKFQGIAAGMVSMLTNYSMSIGLGLAGTVEVYVAPHGDLLQGYRAAFYLGVGLAATAVLVVGIFIRMPKMAQYRE